ncbi:MAG: stage II sporulation protein M [Candidatus Woesearchaeota archaeon]
MVLEQVISTNWLRRRPLYAVFLGLCYTFIGAITGHLFFQDKFSVSLLFLVTLLLVPSLMNLLSFEEERERSEGLKRFFQNHKSVFEIYLFISIGIFIGYIAVIWVLGVSGIELSSTVGEQMKVLGGEITIDQIKNFETNSFLHSINLFVNNLGVAVIFFILSFFYGAGAIFLMVWNASIFATFVTLTIKNISRGVSNSFALLGAFSIYIIPEIAGFLLAAIAGGVISKAVIVEEFMSNSFRNVVKDAFILLLYSFALLLMAAFLEAYVGVGLIKALV